MESLDCVFTIELDRSDILSILIYVLMKACISDLKSQLVLLECFTSYAIQDGYYRISAAFKDF